MLIYILPLFLKGTLSHEEKEQAKVEHGISSLQKDMVRLNTLITEKRGQQEKLVQGNILTENDFINALKVSQQVGRITKYYAEILGHFTPD